MNQHFKAELHIHTESIDPLTEKEVLDWLHRQFAGADVRHVLIPSVKEVVKPASAQEAAERGV